MTHIFIKYGKRETSKIPKVIYIIGGFPGSLAGKESACNVGDPSSVPGSGSPPGERDKLPTPVFLGFPCGSAGKESACNVGDLGSITGLGRFPGGEGMATNSSILAQESPWAEEPDGLHFMGSQRVRHN